MHQDSVKRAFEDMNNTLDMFTAMLEDLRDYMKEVNASLEEVNNYTSPGELHNADEESNGPQTHD